MSEEAAKYFKANIDKCIKMTDFEFAEAYAQSKLKAVEQDLIDDLLDEMSGVFPEYHFEIVKNYLDDTPI